MMIHQIKFKLKKRKRIGRGKVGGNYSGRGLKGQKSRAGRRIRPAERDVIIRIPKKRGFKFRSLSPKPIVVNLEKINKIFNEGERVDLFSLKDKKVVKIPKSKKNIKVKILSKGELRKKLIFSSELLFSQKAKEKIINSGSSIE